MNNTKQNNTYFLYVRKSSESEDRQVQSIDDQTNRLIELAQSLNLKIKARFIEAKSAKKPNNRPKFTEMIERIENGEADGILCWQINRLSRNPIDSAQLQWLLQQNILKSIKTYEREYRPEDNVLLFSVESGMANQFVLDLSKNVKRGTLHKVKNGWKPGIANIGYLNNLEDHTLIPDPDRFDLIRKAWDLMLSGHYTVPKVLDVLNNDWGFRTKKRKRSGDRPMSMSGLYKLFTNVFYTGNFMFNDEEYIGKHKKMITMEEFEKVQSILGKKGKPRPKKYKFSFTGLIRCGECGCSITAEKKKKFIIRTGEYKYYTYYHCTRKKNDIKCTQRKSISEDKLYSLLFEEVNKLSILPQFYDWAVEALNQYNDKEIVDRTKIYDSLNTTILKTQSELDNLTRMRYRELIDDKTFINEKEILQANLKKLKRELRQIEERAESWLELTEKVFHLASYAREHFMNGTIEQKKDVLTGLGSNFLLKDKKLTIQVHKWLEPIINNYKDLEDEYLRLEPRNYASTKQKTEAFRPLILQWHGWRESNSQYRFWRPVVYH